MKKDKTGVTEIVIGGIAYPVVKETKLNYIIQYGYDRRLFNKRRKRLVEAGYDKRKRKNLPLACSKCDIEYNKNEHIELLKRALKIKKRLGLQNQQIARVLDVADSTVSKFFSQQLINGYSLDLFREWVESNEVGLVG